MPFYFFINVLCSESETTTHYGVINIMLLRYVYKIHWPKAFERCREIVKQFLQDVNLKLQHSCDKSYWTSFGKTSRPLALPK